MKADKNKADKEETEVKAAMAMQNELAEQHAREEQATQFRLCMLFLNCSTYLVHRKSANLPMLKLSGKEAHMAT